MQSIRKPTCVASTRNRPWAAVTVSAVKTSPDLTFSGWRHQRIRGWGGCFNELGAIALNSLPSARRTALLRELFHPAGGCRFNLCRMPIGANDYAAEWYSHDETDGDFSMRHFSIGRDRVHLLPYIKAALALQPGLRLFASPWSPPTWMKFPKAHNFGTFIMKPQYLAAYALYFRRFVEAYRREGVTIHQIHPQNEPLADQKFPSCLWTGEDMARFIGRYLGPEFKRAGLSTKIWLGTLNTEDFNGWPRTVLSDPHARRHIRGIGLQWAGRGMVQRIHEAYPAMPVMQTENECGDGSNTWEYAEYVFNLMRHYFGNGAEAHIYWNMILAPEGVSTWGWKQNALITIDQKSGRVTLNPEFYLYRHFSRFVKAGAVRLGLAGEWSGNALAFENSFGERVLVIHNPFANACPVVIEGGWRVQLAPHSFATVQLALAPSGQV